MNLIQLHTNDESQKSSELFLLTEAEHETLEEYKTFGGFLRFEIDIIKEQEKGFSQISNIINWLNNSVFTGVDAIILEDEFTTKII